MQAIADTGTSLLVGPPDVIDEINLVGAAFIVVIASASQVAGLHARAADLDQSPAPLPPSRPAACVAARCGGCARPARLCGPHACPLPLRPLQAIGAEPVLVQQCKAMVHQYLPEVRRPYRLLLPAALHLA